MQIWLGSVQLKRVSQSGCLISVNAKFNFSSVRLAGWLPVIGTSTTAEFTSVSFSKVVSAASTATSPINYSAGFTAGNQYNVGEANKLGYFASLSYKNNTEFYEDYANTYYELRKAKNISITTARDLMEDVSYFGTMMVYKGHADGMVSGRYSKPDTDVSVSEYSPEVPHQRGLAPAMLKHLIGRGHSA